MQNVMFWIVVVLATFTVYRLLSRRVATPKARVTAMLRRYRALERSGLSEQECLLQLLATRRDWRGLPHRFLAEIVSRFRSKEDVMRFVSVSEDYGYHRDHYPEIATRIDLEAAMAEVACLLARFGFQLQTEGRFREAEFVQKLALRLQPSQYFTNLPLAATYHETGRHNDALPLFSRASIDSRTSKTIPTRPRRHCLRQSVWDPMWRSGVYGTAIERCTRRALKPPKENHSRSCFFRE